MKKLIVAMMIIALVVVMAVSASAATTADGNYDYEVVGETVKITKYKGEGGKGTIAEAANYVDVTIPATIESKPVTVIGASAFEDFRCVKKITIPASVVTIEDKAFYNCRGLKEIVIPDAVTTIGVDAFYANNVAESLTIGAGVTSIGKGAFGRLSALKTLTVKANANYFKEEGGLLIDVVNKKVLTGEPSENIVVPAGIETIGINAFYGIKGIKSVVLPDGFKTIEREAFQGCSDLKTMVIPSSVSLIEYGAFATSGLKSGNVYYAGTEDELKNLDSTDKKNGSMKITATDADGDGAANNNLIGCANIAYGAYVNNPNGWTHSGADAASCTYCNPPAPPAGDQGGNQTPTTPSKPSAPATGSSVTVLAVVAVVALAATSVVISKRRIED